jgi:hypothetical protein
LYSFIGLVLRAESRRLALGWSMIALGGLRWDYPYYTLLALIGFLLLAQNATREEKQAVSYNPVRSGASL